MPTRIHGMVQFTGWREPISMSGAGKVVDGILRRRPCFLCPLHRLDGTVVWAQMQAWFKKYGVLS
jgi:hypothetical protein